MLGEIILTFFFIFIFKQHCQQTSLRQKNWGGVKLKYCDNNIMCPHNMIVTC